MREFDQPGDGPPDDEPIRDAVRRIFWEALQKVTGGEPEKQEEILERLNEKAKSYFNEHDNPKDL